MLGRSRAVQFICGLAALVASPALAQPVKPQFAPAQSVPAAQSPEITGPSSIEETYESWKVVCRQEAGQTSGGAAAPAQRLCSVVQQQIDEKSKQRVMALEFQRLTADRVEGVAVVPFGVALEQGVTLQLDASPPMQTVRFRTCLPIGCIAPLSFDAKTLAALRKGQVLSLIMTSDNGKSLSLKVVLKGLSPAIDRAMVLAR